MQRKGGQTDYKFEAISVIVRDSRLTEAETRVAFSLINNADPKTGVCTLPYTDLGRRLGLNRRAVARAMHGLEVAGYIQVTSRKSNGGASLPDRYRLDWSRLLSSFKDAA
jgi:DNA-binding MarR family transcriptional regulator